MLGRQHSLRRCEAALALTRRAEIDGAEFSGAQFSLAQFSGAQISGAQISGAQIESALKSIGAEITLHRHNTGGSFFNFLRDMMMPDFRGVKKGDHHIKDSVTQRIGLTQSDTASPFLYVVYRKSPRKLLPDIFVRWNPS